MGYLGLIQQYDKILQKEFVGFITILRVKLNISITDIMRLGILIDGKSSASAALKLLSLQTTET